MLAAIGSIALVSCGGGGSAASKHTAAPVAAPTQHTIVGRISMTCGASTSVLLRADPTLKITDEHNTLLGTAAAVENGDAETAINLAPGSQGPQTCLFDFSVPNVPDTATFYTITATVGNQSFSHAELETSRWRADLKVTSP